MAYSLEARCPMTDYRLVEWAMRLPLEYKLRGGENKNTCLEKYSEVTCPTIRLYRKKVGFRGSYRSVAKGTFARVGA